MITAPALPELKPLCDRLSDFFEDQP